MNARAAMDILSPDLESIHRPSSSPRIDIGGRFTHSSNVIFFAFASTTLAFGGAGGNDGMLVSD
jgi:hypothetical protein